MEQRVWRLYLDTSVFGGVFDVEEGFASPSRRIIEAAVSGKCIVFYSSTVEDELLDAPLRVQELLRSIPLPYRFRVELADEVKALTQAYLDAGIVGRKWLDDCVHVAAATVSRADAIVSWNFKHIVRLGKIERYNMINRQHGFPELTIVSPRGVSFDE